MKAIYKYPIRMAGETIHFLPTDAKVLDVQSQDGEPMVWVWLDPTNPTRVERVFKVVMTGEPISKEGLVYIGTFQSGWFVGHVFEKTSPQNG